jgi:hypothetical protein
MKIKYLIFLTCIVSACTKTSTEPKIILPIILKDSSSSYTLQFSGYTWNVKNFISRNAGPGPNYFDGKNVFVDANGNLHLQIKKDLITGKWTCAELSTVQLFGYGIYQFWVEGTLDRYDKNVVLGLFNYSKKDGFDEMDIEYSRFGNDLSNNLNYTIYPDWDDRNLTFSQVNYSKEINLSTTKTTQRFARTATSVKLQSLLDFTNTNSNEYAANTVSRPLYSVSKYAMPIYINFWLFRGFSPVNGQNAEVIIHSFTFTQ